MNSFSAIPFVRGCFAALMLIVLVSCGGGGSSNSVPTSTATFGNTFAGTEQLANTFAATLSGVEATPPTPSSAQGSGSIVVDPVTRVAVISLVTTGITSVATGTGASINFGVPGTSGPIVFPLTETSLGSGFWTARVVLTADQLSQLQSSAYFFNVRSTTFPNGEIRGQILPQTTPPGTTVTVSNTLSLAPVPSTFISALRGSQEIPANSSTALGSGAAVITTGSNFLRAAVITSGIPGTTARIQIGAAGSPGTVTLLMSETIPGSGIWVLQAALTDSQLSSLVSGNLFFNITSAAFPSGEIRGQILPVLQTLVGASSLTTFGNTPTTTTGINQIGTGVTGTNIIGTNNPATFGNTPTTTTGINQTGTGVTGTNITGTIDTTNLNGTNITGTGMTGLGTSTIGTNFTGTGVTGTNITGTGSVGGTNITGTGSTVGTTGTGTPISTGLITTGM